RASRLVAHFLDQFAARAGRARHDLQRAQARAVSSAQTSTRRDRRAPDDVGGGGAAAGAVVGRALATVEPFLPLAVLGNPVVRCAALAGACAMATLVGMTIFVPLYFEV